MSCGVLLYQFSQAVVVSGHVHIKMFPEFVKWNILIWLDWISVSKNPAKKNNRWCFDNGRCLNIVNTRSIEHNHQWYQAVSVYIHALHLLTFAGSLRQPFLAATCSEWHFAPARHGKAITWQGYQLKNMLVLYLYIHINIISSTHTLLYGHIFVVVCDIWTVGA